ncbi:hypothetical protein JAAARDRAFT_252748 [Jaapia argillacea MUCL 33604]|uniref:Heterokaryon incompatibility domain-containing protein n=1 Tax=Jaapia argillacea MUCL 33604 TaxID=933084 RepID=A0A067Q5V1_9AGAM|nr:hypothetical protein JAAARDRAFT_252748 [Jaapia argillacea MUCL 33604]
MSRSLGKVPKGLLSSLNEIESTHLTLSHPGLTQLLRSFITRDYDFGAVYARLRKIWSIYLTDDDDLSDIYDKSEALATSDEDRRQRSLSPDGETILSPYRIQARGIWDLYAHRVVPLHFSCQYLGDVWGKPNYWAVSHSWTDPMPGVDTAVNSYEWPVPLPPEITLEAVRTELLNLGAEYVWLDVLCLRQFSALPQNEALRPKEWAIDVPTIGNVYSDGASKVVRYYNGLGKAFRKDGWGGERHWLKRAWTLQEIKYGSVSAGLPSGIVDVLEEKSQDGSTLYDHLDRLLSLEVSLSSHGDSLRDFMAIIQEMRGRYSTNPVDKVAGIGMLLRCPTLPIYRATQTPEQAWTMCVKHLSPLLQRELLFCFPTPGDQGIKWRVAWDQLMKWTHHISHDGISTNDLEIGKEGYASYRGFVLRKCTVSELETPYGDSWYRMIAVEKGGKRMEFKFITRVGGMLEGGVYTLVGDHDLTSWVVCKWASQDYMLGRLEKVSVLSMDEDDAQELRRAGICRERLVIFR